MGKHAIYQHLALAVVNLIFSTLWVTRKVVLYAYNIMIYEIKLQKLTPLSGEGLQDRTSNNSIKERVDIRTRGFWEWGQQTFFDLWVLDPNACRCRKKSLQQCYATNEHEKKRVCNEGILEIDHDTFTPLVFSINGSVRRECQKFYLRLAQINLKREDFCNRFQVSRFEQKFALGC